MEKQNVYIDNKMLGIKKNEILLLATTWMDLEGIMLDEISQRKKDKYCMISLYVESKKQNKWINITKQKQSNRYRGQTGGCQRRGKRLWCCKGLGAGGEGDNRGHYWVTELNWTDDIVRVWFMPGRWLWNSVIRQHSKKVYWTSNKTF